MARLLNIFLLVFLSSAFQRGYCSDSTYIAVHWNGATDKPHYGFIFHRKDVKYDPHNGHFENPFNLYVELSDSSFKILKNLLFIFQEPSIKDTTYRLFMSYYVGYFDGDKWVLSRSLYTENDYIAIYRILSKFLKGTKYENDFHSHWTSERVGLPTGLP